MMTDDKNSDLGLWSIVTGDTIQKLGGIPRIQARCIWADPPYNLGVDYGNGYDDKLPAADYLSWCRRWMELAAFHLTDDGSFWVLISDEWADHFGITLKEVGLHRQQWLKWYESFGVNCSKKFARSCRHLFWMVKDPKNFVFHRSGVTRPSARQTKYNDARANPAGRLWDDVWGINPPIPRVCGTFKERIPGVPTQLPLQLLKTVVQCASDPNDIVVDLFSGSGTCTEAAFRLGRRAVGIEINPEYAELSRHRLREVTCGIRPDYSLNLPE